MKSFSKEELDDAQACVNFAVELCVNKAGPLIRTAFQQSEQPGRKVMIKDNKTTDLVTETDQQVERELIGALREKYPDHKFIGEESTAAAGESKQKTKLSSAWTWIIDPVDGTTNFVHGYAEVCICMGLAVGGKLIAGVVYNPILCDLYTAISTQGAFLSQGVNSLPISSKSNRKKLSVSATTTLPSALIATEMGSDRSPEVLEHVERNLMALVRAPVHSVRCCGSAAMNMVHVASGSVDGYYEYGIHCWDIAAAAVILREAGGVVVDAPLASGPGGRRKSSSKDLGELDLMGRRVLAVCNETLAKEISGIIRGFEFPCD